MLTTRNVAVIIPIYKEQLNELEEISLKRCFDILKKYDIIVVKPQSLRLNNYDYEFDHIVAFDDKYFFDIQGYNRLMLSATFYEKFLDYKYILIHQLDAFAFKDDLLKWCFKDFDYIGAPWLRYAAYPDLIKKIKNTTLHSLHLKFNLKQKKKLLPTDRQFENKVGNGGFSLRRTQKLHEICLKEIDMIEYYNNRNEHYYNEDAFWSIEVNRKQKQLNIPKYKEAVYFAIENSYKHGFELTGGELPFGCHAWDKHLEFWAPIFTKIGININDLALNR